MFTCPHFIYFFPVVDQPRPQGFSLLSEERNPGEEVDSEFGPSICSADHIIVLFVLFYLLFWVLTCSWVHI
jgi:hypothetical protein